MALTRLAVAFIAVLCCSPIADAGIVATTGQMTLGPPLDSVVPPANEDNTTIHLFVEQTDVSLAANVDVDMITPSTYDPPNGRTPGTIPMGTIVSSYYIHFDPVSGSDASGSVTFGEPVLGVIAKGDVSYFGNINTLGPSNFLGAGGTSYPDLENFLGIEDDPSPDMVTMYQATVAVRFRAGSPGDRVRVITAATGTGPLFCGNGVIDAGEQCDDAGIVAGDGCDNACQEEACFDCTGAPSTCTPILTCTNGDGCCAPGCTASNDDDCVVAPTPIPTPNPQQRCTAGKINCIAKKKKCLLKCYGKAAGKGMAVDTGCLDKCRDKFDGGAIPEKGCFEKLEAKGGCITNDDTDLLETEVDDFVGETIIQLDQPPLNDLRKCRAGKLKCVAKYDDCLLKANARAQKTGGFPVTTKCTLRFPGCFQKLEQKLTCETVSDAPAIQGRDDTFVHDVVCSLLAGSAEACP